VAVRQPVTIAGAATPIVTTSRIEGSSYTIAKGDTVWEIALRAYGDGFQFVRIAKANNLVNASLIHPGNILKIPR
jgi:nucleoid-associated protein YgaU